MYQRYSMPVFSTHIGPQIGMSKLHWDRWNLTLFVGPHILLSTHASAFHYFCLFVFLYLRVKMTCPIPGHINALHMEPGNSTLHIICSLIYYSLKVKRNWVISHVGFNRLKRSLKRNWVIPNVPILITQVPSHRIFNLFSDFFFPCTWQQLGISWIQWSYLVKRGARPIRFIETVIGIIVLF